MKTVGKGVSLTSLLSLASLLSLLPIAAGAVPLVSDTLNLSKGWNAVYIESTPTNAACEDLFRETPVIAAAAYMSDADAATAQYDSSGKEIVQAPVAFLQWSRGESASTLQSIVGGNTYLVFSTGATNVTFKGVPAAPRITWRKVSSSETNELFNLAGVSSATGGISIQDYFGEGPFGTSTSGRAIYSIGGDDADKGPVLKNASSGAFGRALKLENGRAYALTATRSGSWPGVIGVQGSGVSFDADANYASIAVKNCGTTNHTFSFTMERSAAGEDLPPISRLLPRTDAFSAQQYTNVEESVAWTVSLASGADTEQVFSLDRSRLEAGREYGAILVIEDLGPSKMRVRVPISVETTPESDTAVKFPVGLWSGFIQLEAVSRLDDTNQIPVKAGGTMKMNVMMHVAPDGKVKLLQRVAAGVETNGTPRLFKELDSVPPEVKNARRFSTVMMSIDTPVVEGTGKFGEDLVFDWTVGEKASDNPFRHAWHPDHDGKTADYKGLTPSGDDLGNYAGVVKPELWSIKNRMEFSWHENNDPHKDVNFEWTPSEKTAGFVTWMVEGLTAKEPIRSMGVFVLQRAIKAAEVE